MTERTFVRSGKNVEKVGAKVCIFCSTHRDQRRILGSFKFGNILLLEGRGFPQHLSEVLEHRKRTR